MFRTGAPRDPVRADLKAYLDGELPALRIWRVRWHLAHCSECREEVAWLRRLGADMQDLEQATPRPELRARILASLPPPERVVEAPRLLERAPRAARIGLPRLAFGSMVLICALGGVFAMTRHLHSSQPRVASPSQTAKAGPSHPVLPDPNSPKTPFAAGTALATQPAPPGEVPSLPPGNLPQMPHSNRDPFRPADAPTAPQEIVQNVPDDTGTGGSDGTYAAAVKLYNQRIAALAAEERRRDQMILRQATERSFKGKPLQRPMPAVPVRLAMTVANVDATRTLLQTLVPQMDGTVVPHAEGTSVSPGQGPKGTPSQEPARNIVVLRVPAQSVGDLLHDLERLGTLRQEQPTLHGKPLPDAPADYRLQPSMRTTGPMKERLQQLLPNGSYAPAPGKGSDVPSAQRPLRPGMPTQTRPEQNSSTAYITILLRLQPVPPITP